MVFQMSNNKQNSSVIRSLEILSVLQRGWLPLRTSSTTCRTGSTGPITLTFPASATFLGITTIITPLVRSYTGSLMVMTWHPMWLLLLWEPVNIESHMDLSFLQHHLGALPRSEQRTWLQYCVIRSFSSRWQREQLIRDTRWHLIEVALCKWQYPGITQLFISSHMVISSRMLITSQVRQSLADFNANKNMRFGTCMNRNRCCSL